MPGRHTNVRAVLTPGEFVRRTMAGATLFASIDTSSQSPAIEGADPADWKDLQNQAAQILKESGLRAATEVEIELARGRVTVDVYAEDYTAIPAASYICECKNWKTAVTRTVVHGFRTVIVDSGANAGYVISSAGFQAGAKEAAKFSNVKLVTWPDFQSTFAIRWYREYMAPALWQRGDAFTEYSEPINSRIQRKAAELTEDRRVQYEELRHKYEIASTFLLFLSSGSLADVDVPSLPLRVALNTASKKHPEIGTAGLPDSILDATALRPLMSAILEFYDSVTAEFDAIFGGRA